MIINLIEKLTLGSQEYMLVGGIFFDLLGDTKHFRNIRVGPKIQETKIAVT